MQTFTDILYSSLQEKLKLIEEKKDAPLSKVKLSIDVCLESMSRLKDYVKKEKFITTDAEIHFFKNEKPRFLSLLIYYFFLYNLELNKPVTDESEKIKFYEEQYEQLQVFFRQNRDLIKYYHSKSTFLDSEMFLRNQKNLQLFTEPYVFQFDEDFTTTHDYKLSMVIAYEKLGEYLAKGIKLLKSPETGNLTLTSSAKLNWTSSKVALVELIYALHSAGCINNGKSEISELATFFETHFGTDLGDYYRKYLEIKDRKTNQTKFIDALKDSLLKKMDAELK